MCFVPCRSATVDSQMFSRYFGNCPVITAEGRTHPVSTCFLEDIHESLSYRLASDSPASIRNETSKQKVYLLLIGSMIYNIAMSNYIRGWSLSLFLHIYVCI